MTYNPEHDAVIIREHCRLREEIMKLPVVRGDGDECLVQRGQILNLLYIVEKSVPQRPRVKIILD